MTVKMVILLLEMSTSWYCVWLFGIFSMIVQSNAKPKTFNIKRATIFIFSFCIELLTKLNCPALGVLKHHYITKRIRDLLIGNSTFLIYNLSNQLLCYTV